MDMVVVVALVSFIWFKLWSKSAAHRQKHIESLVKELQETRERFNTLWGTTSQALEMSRNVATENQRLTQENMQLSAIISRAETDILRREMMIARNNDALATKSPEPERSPSLPSTTSRRNIKV